MDIIFLKNFESKSGSTSESLLTKDFLHTLQTQSLNKYRPLSSSREENSIIKFILLQCS